MKYQANRRVLSSARGRYGEAIHVPRVEKFIDPFSSLRVREGGDL